MAKAKKRLTHEECRKAVCFFCLRKGKTPDKYYINETLAEFISRGIFPEFSSRRHYLPSGCCSTCSTKVYDFLSLKRNEPEESIQSDHQNFGWIVNKLHNSRCVEISNELKALPDKNLNCTCTICGIARANPIPKGKSGSSSATITQPLQNILNNSKVQVFDTEINSDDFISNRLPKRRCATELKEGTKLYIERKKFKEQAVSVHDGKKMKFETVLQHSYNTETEKNVDVSKASNYQKEGESMTELRKMLILDIEQKKLYFGKRNENYTEDFNNTKIFFDGVVKASDFQKGDMSVTELKEMLTLDIGRNKFKEKTTSVHDGENMGNYTVHQVSYDIETTKIIDDIATASDSQIRDENFTDYPNVNDFSGFESGEKINLEDLDLLSNKKEISDGLEIKKESFKESTLLKTHNSTVHEAKWPFQCEICHAKLWTSTYLKAHIEAMHEAESQFQCNICNSTFKEEKSIRKHFSAAHEENLPFQCTDCDQCFKKAFKLKEHISSAHEGSLPFQCKSCNKCFSSGHIFFKHISSVHVYRCNFCNCSFKIKSHLNRHIAHYHRVHDGKKMKIDTEIQDSLDLKIVDDKAQASDFQKGDESVTELSTSDIERKKLYNQTASVHDGEKNNIDTELQVSYYTETTKNVDVVSIASDFQKVQVANVHEGQKSFQCSKCNLRYQTKYKLEKHFENIHEKKPYQCGKCKIRFSAQNQLEEHVAIHERKKLFQCMNCDKSFAQKYNLEHHFKNFHESKKEADKLLQCIHCNKSFTQQYSLKTHVLSIHEKEKLKCTLCGKEFNRRDQLNNHIKKVHEGKTVNCRKTVNQISKLESKLITVKTLEPDDLLCDDTLEYEEEKNNSASAQIDQNKSDLQFKELNPAESISEENQTCSECNFNCKTKSLLLNHIRKIHGIIVPYNCPYCEYKGATKQWLQTHVDSVHDEKKGNFVSKNTNVSEKSPNIIEVTKTERSSVCKGEKQLFKCITCDKSFAQKRFLDEHFENIHEVKILLKCEFCSEAFSEGRQMKNHLASVHEGKKFFQCIYCEKHFSYKGRLKTHVLSIHESTKCFKCIICNDEFVNKQKFNKHIQLVHEEKFTCEFCNMSFLRERQLISHIANFHENEKMEGNTKYNYKSIKMVSCKSCGSYFQEMKALANHLVIHSKCRSKENLAFLKRYGIFPTDQKSQSSAILEAKEHEEIKRKESLDLKKHGNFSTDNKSQASTILEMKDYQKAKRTEEHTKAYLMSILT